MMRSRDKALRKSRGAKSQRGVKCQANAKGAPLWERLRNDAKHQLPV